MPPKPIELLKARDFGELINDTFIFIRQNFKPLCKAFFTFCGFFIVAFAVAGCMQQLRVVDMVNGTFSRNTFSGSYGAFRSFGIEFAAAMFFMFLTFNAISVVVYSYMAIYQQKGQVKPTSEEIWGYFKYYYLRILGATIVISILSCLGAVFCLLPGIYLSIVFSFVSPIIIMENGSFGYAFNKSFQLIKDNWWITFGTLVVSWLIAYMSMRVIEMPLAVLNFFQILAHRTHPLNKFYMIGTVILNSICLIFYIIPNVTIGLCYYNLTEVKEGTGLLSRIEEKFGQAPQTGTEGDGEEY